MRHLYGLALAVGMTLVMFFGGGWAYLQLLRLPVLPGQSGSLPANGGSLLSDQSALLAIGVLVAVAVLAGLLATLPQVSPLASGLTGVVLLGWTAIFLMRVQQAVDLIPLRSHSFGAGWEGLLFNGVLAAVGAVMLIPMFIPSRWRELPGASQEDRDASRELPDASRESRDASQELTGASWEDGGASREGRGASQDAPAMAAVTAPTSAKAAKPARAAKTAKATRATKATKAKSRDQDVDEYLDAMRGFDSPDAPEFRDPEPVGAHAIRRASPPNEPPLVGTVLPRRADWPADAMRITGASQALGDPDSFREGTGPGNRRRPPDNGQLGDPYRR